MEVDQPLTTTVTTTRTRSKKSKRTPGEAMVADSEIPARAKKTRSRKKQQQQLIHQQGEEGGAEVSVDADGDAAVVEGSSSSKSAAAERKAKVEIEQWKWITLAEGKASKCPIAFSPDGRLCFIPTSTSIKIHSVATTQHLSTLTPPFQSTTSKTPHAINGLMINPSNQFQLIVSSFDGTVRIWDYLDGKLVRSFDVGYPVLKVAANEKFRDQVFVVTSRKGEHGFKREAAFIGHEELEEEGKERIQHTNRIMYNFSIRRPPKTSTSNPNSLLSPTLTRIGKTRQAGTFGISPNGEYLIVTSKTKIHICHTSRLREGFTSTFYAPEEITCLAFHPNEPYFATGDMKGQIRFWYCLEEETLNFYSQAKLASTTTSDPSSTTTGKAVPVQSLPQPPTSTLHWHSHAVASIQFTPNGAYLISGGEESVLVLWQLGSAGHKEFVPRLGGGGILGIEVLDSAVEGGGVGGDGGGSGGVREQEVVVRLRDGNVGFVGMRELKLVRSIGGIKMGTRHPNPFTPPPISTPFVLTPPALSSNSLILPSSHPSSIQFFSLSTFTNVREVEIVPSNRVSRRDERYVVDPVVERVAFSGSSGAGAGGDLVGKGGVWMASVDSWRQDGFEDEINLKIWSVGRDDQRFTLNTLVNRPHEDSITSLSFSPTEPQLLTTSYDKQVKIWKFFPTPPPPTSSKPGVTGRSGGGGGRWKCRTSFSHRDSTPLSSAWSNDGSMIAVAHRDLVSLWDAENLSLVHTLAFDGIGKVEKVMFLGREGDKVFVGGREGVVVWDLMNFQEIFKLKTSISEIVPKPNSDVFVICERSQSVNDRDDGSETDPRPPRIFIIDLSTTPSARVRQLSFSIRKAVWLPTRTAQGKVSLLVETDAGDICLVGDEPDADDRELRSATKIRKDVAGGGSTRLFDDIFGSYDFGVGEPEVEDITEALSATNLKGIGAYDRDGVLNVPSHVMPPVHLFWQSLTQHSLQPLSRVTVSQDQEEEAGGEDEDRMDVDQEQREEVGGGAVQPPRLFEESPSVMKDVFRAALVGDGGK